MRGRTFALILIGLLATGHDACARADRLPTITGVRVGLSGHYKAGLWTPVEVVLAGGTEPAEGQIVLTVPDGDGVPTQFSTALDAPCRVEPGREFRNVLYVRFGRRESSLAVEFRDRQGLRVQRLFQAGAVPEGSVFPPAVSSKEVLIAVVGRDAMGVEEAVKGLRAQSGEHATVVRLDDLSALPTRWYGYEGIDLVALSTSRPEIFAAPLEPDAQIAALEQWVRLGGKLLLSVGRSGKAVLAIRGALARLAPGEFQQTVPLRQTNALESYIESRVPIPSGAAGALRVSQIERAQGVVEAREGTLPLIVRRALGFGQVIFTAFDLDEGPLRDWPDRGVLVGKLLDLGAASLENVREGRGIIRHGYDDLAGQLRSALDQFPEVILVPFWSIVVIVAGYLILIGPGDYFLVRKVFGRAATTWITFPLAVVGVSAGLYVLANAIKGHQVRLNQVDLIDVDLPTGEVRGTSWANVFSPRVDQYDLTWAPRGLGGPSEAGSLLLSWFGLPGEGLGAMNARTIAPATWRQPYEFASSLDALTRVPIQVWSTKSLAARWNGRQSVVPIRAVLSDEERNLTGSVTSELDFPLKGSLLCYGRWAYELGNLERGRPIQIGLSVQRRDLKTLLTGRKLVLGENREINTPYDRASTDLAYVLRAMMFFKAAGGYHYTGLANRYQAFVDLSDVLQAGHAILVAEAPTAAEASQGVQILRNGAPLDAAEAEHLTVYRFVLPVKKLEAGP